MSATEAERMLIEDLDRATNDLRFTPDTEKPECTVHHSPIRSGLIVLLRIERHRLTNQAAGASKGAVAAIASLTSAVALGVSKMFESYMAGR
jgi:hypothetical protein